MTLGAVILAAGSGTRLGGVAKALLRTGDETYLARIVRIARLAGTTRFVVVVGRPHDQQVGDAARALGLDVVINPGPERGMASSIALGFTTMSHHEVDAAWLWPVDHPNVELGTLEALLAARGTHEVCQPRFGGRGGHPPLVARALWSRLAACADVEGGARTVMATASIARVPVEDGGVVRDIDTPADLAEVG